MNFKCCLRYYALSVIICSFSIHAASQVVNPIENDRLIPETEDDYGRFGNYDSCLFILGWYDAKGFERFESISEYRDSLGPINTILCRHNLLDTIFRSSQGEEFKSYTTYYNWFANIDNSTKPFKTIIGPYGCNKGEIPSITGAPWDTVTTRAESTIINIEAVYSGTFADEVWGWLSVDEPNGGVTTVDSAAVCSLNARVLKAETLCTIPHLPVFLNIGAKESYPEQFEEYGSIPNVDVVMTDVYPIQYTSRYFATNDTQPLYDIRRPGYKVDSLNARSGNKPLCMILQGMATKQDSVSYYKNYWNGQDSVLAYSKMFRVPSYAEYRFMAWDCILRGARGLIFWEATFVYDDPPARRDTNPSANGKLFYDIYDLDNDGIVFETISVDDIYEERCIFNNTKEIFNELEPLTELMARGTYVDGAVTIGPDSTDAIGCMLVRETYHPDSAYYLVAVNRKFTGANSPAVAETFALDSAYFHGYRTVTRLDPFAYDSSAHYDNLSALTDIYDITPDRRSNRQIARFTDSFEPGEVHIYKFTKDGV